MRSGLWHTLKHLYARPTNKNVANTGLLGLPRTKYSVDYYVDDEGFTVNYNPGPTIIMSAQKNHILLTYRYPYFDLIYDQKDRHRLDASIITITKGGVIYKTKYEAQYYIIE